MTPQGQDWAIILHICKESVFVAQVSDVTPGPLISGSFEVKKQLKVVERILVSDIKCL